MLARNPSAVAAATTTPLSLLPGCCACRADGDASGGGETAVEWSLRFRCFPVGWGPCCALLLQLRVFSCFKIIVLRDATQERRCDFFLSREQIIESHSQSFLDAGTDTDWLSLAQQQLQALLGTVNERHLGGWQGLRWCAYGE